MTIPIRWEQTNATSDPVAVAWAVVLADGSVIYVTAYRA